MDWLIKAMGPKALLALLPFILIKVGNMVKGKDSNETGMDDAFGNVLIAAAPAIEAFEDGNENAFKKALKVTYNTLGNYLGEPPRT